MYSVFQTLIFFLWEMILRRLWDGQVIDVGFPCNFDPPPPDDNDSWCEPCSSISDLTRKCGYRHCVEPAVDFWEDETSHPCHNIAIPFINDDVIADYIQPVCLPSAIDNDEKNLYYLNMTVAGWGTMENCEYYFLPFTFRRTWVQNLGFKSATASNLICCTKDEVPQTRHPHALQDVDVVVRPTEFCDVRLGMQFDWVSQICAGPNEPDISPCPGDSGGPLMYYNTTGGSGRYVVMGIVSGGFPCMHGNLEAHPGIYARVSTAMPWILNSIH
ncbi:serine-type endopeptidase activity protein [Homalodisca vitripennis]|nr:serine-type endopeptidase activity protein [Homalodisca vitripennis]